MSRISSDTLFHFTDSKWFASILEKEFEPRWSLEEYSFGNMEFKLGIPMVCFCDIPLGQIHEHLEIYGHCGLGLRKAWAKEQKLNPVLYLDRDSDFAKLIYDTLTQVHEEKTAVEASGILVESQATLMKKLIRLNCYCKMIDGVSRKTNKYKKYYDEREWRFVPDIEDIDVKYYMIPEDQFKPEFIEGENEKIKSKKLIFSPSDINYVIVEKESDRKEIMEIIETVKWRYSKEDRDILKSKIITSEQICRDF